NLRDDAMREDLPMARIMDVHRVVIERGHRGDNAGQHRHRMCVVLKSVEEPEQRLVDHRVILNRVRELRELLARRQLTVDQQISNLEAVAFFCEWLARKSPIPQYPRGAIR